MIKLDHNFLRLLLLSTCETNEPVWDALSSGLNTAEKVLKAYLRSTGKTRPRKWTREYLEHTLFGLYQEGLLEHAEYTWVTSRIDRFRIILTVSGTWALQNALLKYQIKDWSGPIKVLDLSLRRISAWWPRDLRWLPGLKYMVDPKLRKPFFGQGNNDRYCSMYAVHFYDNPLQAAMHAVSHSTYVTYGYRLARVILAVKPLGKVRYYHDLGIAHGLEVLGVVSVNLRPGPELRPGLNYGGYELNRAKLEGFGNRMYNDPPMRGAQRIVRQFYKQQAKRYVIGSDGKGATSDADSPEYPYWCTNLPLAYFPRDKRKRPRR